MKWTAHVARLKKMRKSYKILLEKSEEKRPLRRHWRRWKYNIIVSPLDPLLGQLNAFQILTTNFVVNFVIVLPI